MPNQPSKAVYDLRILIGPAASIALMAATKNFQPEVLKTAGMLAFGMSFLTFTASFFVRAFTPDPKKFFRFSVMLAYAFLAATLLAYILFFDPNGRVGGLSAMPWLCAKLFFFASPTVWGIPHSLRRRLPS